MACPSRDAAVVCLLTGWSAWQGGIPGGYELFVFMVIFSLASTIVTAIVLRGDYAKGPRALSPGYAHYCRPLDKRVSLDLFGVLLHVLAKWGQSACTTPGVWRPPWR
jgi:hypothetical protein